MSDRSDPAALPADLARVTPTDPLGICNGPPGSGVNPIPPPSMRRLRPGFRVLGYGPGICRDPLVGIRCVCGWHDIVCVRRGGSLLYFSEHCTTCHVSTHFACVGCGRCLPPSGFFYQAEREERRWRQRNGLDPGNDVTRADRLTCSSACRQRAYRRRRIQEATA